MTPPTTTTFFIGEHSYTTTTTTKQCDDVGLSTLAHYERNFTDGASRYEPLLTQSLPEPSVLPPNLFLQLRRRTRGTHPSANHTPMLCESAGERRTYGIM